MKIEEAIETLEEKRKYCKMFYELSANPQEDYPSTAKFMDALELALTALRSTQQLGKPLTLEQLREMDGKPVWVEFIGHPDGTPIEPLWMLVNCREKRLVTDVEYVDWNFEGWFAYSYPPAHIDRSKWKPCVDCRIKCRTCVVRGKEKCARCEKYSEYVPENNFCSNCGRPLTEAAWAELERRLRG